MNNITSATIEAVNRLKSKESTKPVIMQECATKYGLSIEQMEKCILDSAADEAAEELRQNRLNGSQVSFVRIVVNCADTYGLLFKELQIELTERSARKRRNNAVRKSQIP